MTPINHAEERWQNRMTPNARRLGNAYETPKSRKRSVEHLNHTQRSIPHVLRFVWHLKHRR